MNANGAAPSHGDPCVTAIPRTIAAINDALPLVRREEFHAAVTHAEQGDALDTVLSTWWLEAMFEAVPDRDQRLDDTVAAVGLVELPEADD
ncbi:hypothetical protein [Streptomyces sp. NPDC058735]|uniref:hypothetical protein n=1 Tax=unclassified Streptomyces TaxID=2593676 RepID=UPI0036CCCD2A